MKKNNVTKDITFSAILASTAILLGYIESLIPVFPPIAGIKLGLGNIVVLMALLQMKSPVYPIGIMLTKVIICAVLFGGLGSMPYSLAGGIISLVIMTVTSRTSCFSAAGISTLGGASHMIAQVCVASAVTASVDVLRIMPILLAVGAVTGFVNGIIVNILQKRLNVGFAMITKN